MSRALSALARLALPDAEPGSLVQTRWQLLALGGALLAATLWPVRENWRATPRDGFPFSYYPMFSAKRGRNVEVTHLIGIEDDGRAHVIPTNFVGSGGMNQTRKQIRRMVAMGRADELAEIAAADIRLRGLRAIARVDVVTGIYDMDRYYRGDRRAVRATLHASVAVWPEAA